MPRYTLTQTQVAKIKARLWRGQTCEHIAPDYDVSVSMIRSILAGIRWATVPWPDKSLGAISPDRRKHINETRRKVQREAYKAVEKRLGRE